MKRLLLAFTVFVFTASLFGESLFPRITNEESAEIAKGGTLLHSLKTEKDLLLNQDLPRGKELDHFLGKLRPNYLSEVITLIPLEDGKTGETIFSALKKALLDVKGYKSIPYFSKQWNKTYDLFEWIKTDSVTETDNSIRINVTQNMKPFGEMKVIYTLKESGEGLTFTSENITPIQYKGVKAVKPGKMKWYLTVFPYNNSLGFYSVGTAKAFDMFGTLRSRLEPAFIGRAEAFFVYMLGKTLGKTVSVISNHYNELDNAF